MTRIFEIHLLSNHIVEMDVYPYHLFQDVEELTDTPRTLWHFKLWPKRIEERGVAPM